MDYIKIKFSDFTTMENYVKLQEKFMHLDINCDEDFVLDQILDSITVNYLTRDLMDADDIMVKLDFHTDFLNLKIPEMGYLQLKYFLRKLQNQYTIDAKEGLAKLQIQLVRETKKKIKNSQFLSDSIIKHLMEQLDYLEEGVERYLQNPYPEIKRKIQFKWNRTDVEYFFHLLRINKQIASINERDLGRLIDNTIECLDSKTGEYKEIKSSYRHLNAFYNTEGRPQQPAIDRLSKIFTNPDFYNQ